MGLAGSLAPIAPSTAYSNSVQAAAAQSRLHGVQWAVQQASWHPQQSYPTVSVNAAELKIQGQIRRLVDALPVSICSRIMLVGFYPAFQETPMKFVITFDTQKEVVFTDVDNFPSEEHIAHVALACP